MLTKNKKGYIKNLLKTGLYSIICGILVGIAIFVFNLSKSVLKKTRK